MLAEILTAEERERYARHLVLPDFGEEGQLRLKNGSVLVIGAGGLGSPVCLYLAAAGIGRIGIADGDVVDLSNLQRQVIHDTTRIGMSKAISAARTMEALNPGVVVEPYAEMLTDRNIDRVVSGYDFIIDATDSFAAKLLINDACVRADRPLSHGAIWRYEGHTMTVVPGGACARCLFADEPELSAVTAGPLGATAGMLGTIQAAEAIKWISGVGQPLVNTLLRFDTLTMEFTRIHVEPSADCHNHN